MQTTSTSIVSMLLLISTCIVGASSSKDTGKQLGAKSLQELVYRAVGQDQQFHVYCAWIPLDKEQTIGAIIDELERTIPANDDPAYEHQRTMWKIWVPESVTAVAEDIAYLLEHQHNKINTIYGGIECMLKMSSVYARSGLVRQFESLVKELQYWPDANRLRTISTKLINGLDHTRPTYTQTKKAYTQYLNLIIKKAETQTRHELVAKLASLIQEYNDLGLQVTLPAAWTTDAVADDIQITPVTSPEELDIKARACMQRFHIYPVQYYQISETQTHASILAELNQHGLINPNQNSWIREGIMQSMSDHSLLRNSPCPQQIAWYHTKFDELETMLAQHDFSAKTLENIGDGFREITNHRQDLPTPEKLILSCNRIIANLDHSRCTYRRVYHMYVTWRDKQVAAIHELNRRYALIQQQYNDQEIDKKYADIEKEQERRAAAFRRQQHCNLSLLRT